LTAIFVNIFGDWRLLPFRLPIELEAPGRKLLQLMSPGAAVKETFLSPPLDGER
jgi:hypothetical protein